MPIVCPLFFRYDINGEKLIEAVRKILSEYPILCGRVKRHKEMRFVVEISPEQPNGSLYTELRTDMTMAEVILKHTKSEVDSATFPVFPELPFYSISSSPKFLARGEEEMMKIKLTHLRDGCVLCVTIPHLVMDSHRYAQVLCDLSLVYRGEKIKKKDHDRHYLWPDQLKNQFEFLGEEIESLPRKASPTWTKLQCKKYPNDSAETYALWVSEGDLHRMKKTVESFIGVRASLTNHVLITAFCWMLSCEMEEQQELEETFFISKEDLLRYNKRVVPSNYSGNAFILHLMKDCRSAGAHESIKERFSRLVGMTDSALGELKSEKLLAQGLLFHYHLASAGTNLPPLPSEQLKGISTDLSESAMKKTDFGRGSPAYIHHFPQPMCGGMWVVGLGIKGDGVIVHFHLRGSLKEKLKNSVVVKDLSSRSRHIYDLTHAELDHILNL